MTVDRVGVHVTHCCLLHGCKYGDFQCPVAKQEVLQEHDCEFCSLDTEYVDSLVRQFVIELWNDSAWVVVDNFESSVREAVQTLRQYRADAPDVVKHRLRYRIVEPWSEIEVR